MTANELGFKDDFRELPDAVKIGQTDGKVHEGAAVKLHELILRQAEEANELSYQTVVDVMRSYQVGVVLDYVTRHAGKATVGSDDHKAAVKAGKNLANNFQNRRRKQIDRIREEAGMEPLPANPDREERAVNPETVAARKVEKVAKAADDLSPECGALVRAFTAGDYQTCLAIIEAAIAAASTAKAA